MTQTELREALNADNPYNRFYTVEEAENAKEDTPFVDALRKHNDFVERLWAKRGTNPITVADSEMV